MSRSKELAVQLFRILNEESLMADKWAEFKKKHNLDISFEEFVKIKREEDAADQAQAQREAEGHMEGSCIEEPNAKCNLCYADLSIIENLCYGNRCVFCAPSAPGGLPLKNFRLWEYLWLCYWDWRIYQAIVGLWVVRGKDLANRLLLGCLGEMGYGGIAQLKTGKEKKRLCRNLRLYSKKGEE